LSFVFVTCNAVLAFTGITSLSNKIVTVEFEKIDTNGDFILMGDFDSLVASFKI
jgi:hypothetical protein